MQVKTYTGPNSSDLLAQIKADLGPDAVILGNRTFKENGVRIIEMTAGVDRKPAAAPPKAGSGLTESSDAPQSMPSGWADWHKDWMHIRDHLFSLMRPSMQLDLLTPRQRVALEYLQREGVSDMASVEIYRRMIADRDAPVLSSLGSLVPVRSFSAENWPQHVHFITGPYGAGKTTVALRLALHIRRHAPQLRVAFINADCERGNGRMLLKHWAELSEFGYGEAADSESMHSALMNASASFDIIFVDVPGLPHGKKFSEWLQAEGLEKLEAAAHLVLPPHYDAVHTSALLERYASPFPSGIIWCKLDESVSFGSLVNVACTSHLPVSAFSYGAGLTDSLTPATEALLWRLIFKRQLPGKT